MPVLRTRILWGTRSCRYQWFIAFTVLLCYYKKSFKCNFQVISANPASATTTSMSAMWTRVTSSAGSAKSVWTTPMERAVSDVSLGTSETPSAWKIAKVLHGLDRSRPQHPNYPWFFSWSSECYCDQIGSELCDHTNGFCQCLPGVEGDKCDRCMVNHWGFDNGQPVRNQ